MQKRRKKTRAKVRARRPASRARSKRTARKRVLRRVQKPKRKPAPRKTRAGKVRPAHKRRRTTRIAVRPTRTKVERRVKRRYRVMKVQGKRPRATRPQLKKVVGLARRMRAKQHEDKSLRVVVRKGKEYRSVVVQARSEDEMLAALIAELAELGERYDEKASTYYIESATIRAVSDTTS